MKEKEDQLLNPYILIVYLQILKFYHGQEDFGLLVKTKKSCKYQVEPF